MKKKIMAFFLCTCTAVSLFGCGSTKASQLVELGDYKNLEIDVDAEYEIKDSSVQEMIEDYFLTAPIYTVDESKKVVSDGDVVNIDYEGTKDGTAFDGGTAEGYDLEIGSGIFIEGFEEGLVGVSVGDSKDLNLTFPEDYGNEDLAGAEVVFHVTVNAIETESYPTYDTLTDDYVKENYSTYYGINSVEELQEYVQDYLEQSLDSIVAQELTDKLKDISKIDDIPDSLLKERTKELKSYYQGLAKSEDMEFEDYLKSTYNMTEDEFNEQIDELMPEYIKSDLVWEAVAEKEGITAKDKGYDKFVTKMMEQLDFDSRKELYEVYPKTMVQRMFIEQEAKDKLAEKIKINYVENKDAQTEGAVEGDTAETDNAGTEE